MIIYYCTSIISILITRINSKNLFVAMLLLFIYGIVRVDFGNDYNAYLTLFNSVKSSSLFDSLFGRTAGEFQEPGFILLNYLMPNYRFLIIITSFFSCFTIYKFFKKFLEPKSYWFALFLLFFSTFIFFQFTGLRNAIAVNLFVLSFVYMDKKKIFYLILFSTILFHFSSIFFVPIAILFYRLKRIKTIIIVSIIVFVFSLFFDPINYIYLTQYFGLFLNEHFSNYIVQLSEFQSEFSYLIFLFSSFILFVLLNTLSNNIHRLNSTDFLIIKFSIIYVLLFNAGAIASRGPIWFYLFFIISPYIISKYQKVEFKILYYVAMLAYICYSFFIVFLNREQFQYTDFITIFN